MNIKLTLLSPRSFLSCRNRQSQGSIDLMSAATTHNDGGRAVGRPATIRCTQGMIAYAVSANGMTLSIRGSHTQTIQQVADVPEARKSAIPGLGPASYMDGRPVYRLTVKPGPGQFNVIYVTGLWALEYDSRTVTSNNTPVILFTKPENHWEWSQHSKPLSWAPSRKLIKVPSLTPASSKVTAPA